ncbi:hypothetical protein C8R48DRAFT_769429 [Suillus tomentosus]|nr:hypothetical protein C8R48DRAFT_769429 [Suillus tomentosus]
MSLSDGSVSSTRSLRSQGLIQDKDMLPRSDRSRKAPAHWTHDEEARFLQYLLTHKAQAGDTMSFKKSTFQGAAADISQVFPNQHGGKKTANLHLLSLHLPATPAAHNAMNLMQLASATDEINIDQSSPLAQASMMPPSLSSHSRPPTSGRTVSSTFSSTTSDSGLTSVSRAKCKFSTLPNEGEWQSQKQSRAPSASTSCLISSVTQTEGLSMDNVMDLMDYLSSNPTEAVVFTNFHGTEYRATWARRKLSVIRRGATY